MNLDALQFSPGAYLAPAVDWLNMNFHPFFDGIARLIEAVLGSIEAVLLYPPPYAAIMVAVLLAAFFVGVRVAMVTAIALIFCLLAGFWAASMQTLALVATATILALIVGIPIGIVAGFAKAFDNALEPVLDLIQTMPPYIYLLPAIALLGYGPATALVATVIVAMPPAIRLTSLGIRMTPNEFIELGQATGLTPWQMFTKIRLPFAIPSIMAGINQSLMMAFGMVVIAGIVGSGGLGETIYGAVRTLDIATSINAAIAIVILIMVLDRLTQSAADSAKAGAR